MRELKMLWCVGKTMRHTLLFKVTIDTESMSYTIPNRAHFQVAWNTIPYPRPKHMQGGSDCYWYYAGTRHHPKMIKLLELTVVFLYKYYEGFNENLKWVINI
jgi:hypothetical protein